MTIEQLSAMADRVLALQDKLINSFPGTTYKHHAKLALMAGLKDAFVSGKKSSGTSNNDDVDIALIQDGDIITMHFPGGVSFSKGSELLDELVKRDIDIGEFSSEFYPPPTPQEDE